MIQVIKPAPTPGRFSTWAWAARPAETPDIAPRLRPTRPIRRVRTTLTDDAASPQHDDCTRLQAVHGLSEELVFTLTVGTRAFLLGAGLATLQTGSPATVGGLAGARVRDRRRRAKGCVVIPDSWTIEDA